MGRLRTIEALRGKRVGTLNQTFAHDLLKAASVEIVLDEGNEEPDLDQRWARRCRVDGQRHCRSIRLQSHGHNLLAHGSCARHLCCWHSAQRHQLKAAIDQALASMRQDGELERILRKAKLWDDRQHEASVMAAARVVEAVPPQHLGILTAINYGYFYPLPS